MIPNLWAIDEVLVIVDALEELLQCISNTPSEWTEHVLWQKDLPASQLKCITTDKIALAVGQIHIVGDLAAHSHILKEILLDRRCFRVARYLLEEDIVCHFSNATIRPARVGCSCNWHRDWPNMFMTTRSGNQLRLMICLDGMTQGQGATRVIPGSHLWSQEQYDIWRKREASLGEAGESLICPPGSLVILGPTIVHGAESNLSETPRRNLIAQWGRKSDVICIDIMESLTGFTPDEAK